MSAALSCWLLARFSTSSAAIIEDELERLILSGRVSTARRYAFEHLQENPTKEAQKYLSKVFTKAFEKALVKNDDNFLTEIVQQGTKQDNRDHWYPHVKHDDENCVPVPIMVDRHSSDNKVSSLQQWEDCCSILPTIINSKPASGSTVPSWQGTSALEQDANTCPVANPCCAIFPGSLSYLKLPMLQEPVLSVRIKLVPDLDQPFREKTLPIEQDAYLRPFDPAGVLWPTGFLLSQCVANPIQCGLHDGIHKAWNFHCQRRNAAKPFAIELGAGLGVPSIALSLLFDLMGTSQDDASGRSIEPLVTTTDVAQSALAATITNAQINGVSIRPLILNHFNITEVKAAKDAMFPQGGGYSLVMGSSLQSFFDNGNDPTSTLWMVLDILLDRNNPHALAIFVHGKSALVAPEDGSFELIQKISGDQFGMQTLWGEPSDFEIFVFRRPSKSREGDEL